MVHDQRPPRKSEAKSNFDRSTDTQYSTDDLVAELRQMADRGELEQALDHQQLGRYEIEQVLGSRGQASVLLAFDPVLDRQVVIKLYHQAVSAAQKERMIAEGRALSKIDSPYVANCLGVEECDGFPFLVLQYIPGQTLTDMVNRRGPLDHQMATRYIQQIARGLASVHELGLLHRDLKPGNVIVNDERVVLVDFGLAIQMDQLDQIDASGTPAFMAPEQARGDGHMMDERTDVYGLCAVWYFVLTGDPPPASEPMTDTDDQPVLQAMQTVAPESIAAACARGLQPSPADRYESVGELLAQIDNESQRHARNKPLHWAAAVAAVSLMAVLGWWMTSNSTTNKSTKQPKTNPTNVADTFGEPFDKTELQELTSLAGSILKTDYEVVVLTDNLAPFQLRKLSAVLQEHVAARKVLYDNRNPIGAEKLLGPIKQRLTGLCGASDPLTLAAHFDWCLTLYITDNEKAIEVGEDLLRHYKNNPLVDPLELISLQNNLGQVYHKFGFYSQAEKHLRACQPANDLEDATLSHIWPLDSLAKLLIDKEEFVEAGECIDRALVMVDQLNRGTERINEQLGRYDHVKQLFLLRRAQWLNAQGKYADALSTAGQTRKWCANDARHYPQDRQQLMRTITDEAPIFLLMYRAAAQTGDAEFGLNQIGDARAKFEQALKIVDGNFAPYAAEQHYNIARCNRLEQNYDAAFEAISAAIDRLGDPPPRHLRDALTSYHEEREKINDLRGNQ